MVGASETAIGALASDEVCGESAGEVEELVILVCNGIEFCAVAMKVGEFVVDAGDVDDIEAVDGWSADLSNLSLFDLWDVDR